MIAREAGGQWRDRAKTIQTGEAEPFRLRRPACAGVILFSSSDWIEPHGAPIAFKGKPPSAVLRTLERGALCDI